MSDFVQNLNFALATGTLLLQILTIGVLLLLLTPQKQAVIRHIGSYGLLFAFLVTLASVGISLFYSNVLGFEPCSLCWFQRIFLYPQLFLLGLALIKKDLRIADYSIILSIVGAIIALYQHYLQMGGSPFVSCSAGSDSVDCARRLIFEYGYITLPLMSFTIFAALIVVMIITKRYAAQSTI